MSATRTDPATWCWCGATATVMNAQTDASPQHPACDRHVEDGFVVLAPRNTAVNVHTGFPISLARRTVSARLARSPHSRVVHCRRAAMYVAVGDHSRRFGPERERDVCEACGRARSGDPDFCGECVALMAAKRAV